jgi:hypothetical protein
MKRFLCVALLCAVGCTSVPTATEPPFSAAKEENIQVWIPNFFADLWETVDARIAMDYGFGAHVKLTDLARVGIFDYSDFALLGTGAGTFFKGEYDFPNMDPTTKNGSWDLSIKVGVGLGAEATLHTWEVVDALSTLVTAGYWSFNHD